MFPISISTCKCITSGDQLVMFITTNELLVTVPEYVHSLMME